MNKSKRVIFMVYCFLIVLICLFIPEAYRHPYGFNFVKYNFIFTAPPGNILFRRMILEFIIITALCGIALLITRFKKSK
jgi:uncharacterized membrane protein